MALSLKKIFSNTILLTGCIYSFVYLLSCLTPFISPTVWSGFTFLALAFPILFCVMLFWLFIVFIFYKKYRWLFLIVTLLGSTNIFNIVAFNFPSKFMQEKQEGNIRILSWNVQDFIDSQIYNDTPGSVRRKMMEFIKNTDADILCFQDFQEHTSTLFRSCVKDITTQLNYPFKYFSRDFETKRYYAFIQYGTIIFSRYPIIDSGRTTYSNKNFSESLAFADIKKGNDTFRIFNTHLKSMYLGLVMDTLAFKDEFIKDDLDFLMKNQDKFSRLKYYDKVHAAQAKIVKEQLNKSKYPFIFCGDLNSVPSSYTYHTIQKNLTDAFKSKGFGFGRTYREISPTLRIDAVLLSKQFKVLQYYSPQLSNASDHYPILVDVKLP
ncbi:MAG TPA: endonuclease/exonuclease/phosphatase family protein [Chitinophagaceae bacterium]|nr:endonuclease/exonuclease/phosphatase family protein [Chitinophagaceae bacterium]HNJ58376.1 endonuclease/exonuclease/phosphatase family protein [Chitinophagaceae bacterium]